MSEHIQPLLERIQSEGLKKSKEAQEEILSDARAKAESIVSSAQKQAAEILSDAEAQAEAKGTQGTTALEQAARDVVLKLRAEIGRQVNVAAEKAATASLSSEEVLSTLLPELAKSGSGNLVIETGSLMEKKIKEVLPALLKDAGKEAKIEMNPKTGAGFVLRFEESPEVIDFTSQAVADWLSQNLRSDIATLLRNQNDGT